MLEHGPTLRQRDLSLIDIVEIASNGRRPGVESIAMYACGMSMREIQGFLLERYGIEVSPNFISTVTDEVRAW